MHHMEADWAYGKNTWWQFHKYATSYIEQNPGSNIPHSNSCTATYNLSRKQSKLDEQDMRDTVGEVWAN